MRDYASAKEFRSQWLAFKSETWTTARSRSALDRAMAALAAAGGEAAEAGDAAAGAEFGKSLERIKGALKSSKEDGAAALLALEF